MTKIIIYSEKGLSTKCIHENGSEIKTTAPKDNQGTGDLFSPTDLFVTALGSCMLTLMEIAAMKRNIDLHMRVEVEKVMAMRPRRRIGKVILHFYSDDAFNEAIQEELRAFAKTCPVHESIHPDIVVEMHFHWGKD